MMGEIQYRTLLQKKGRNLTLDEKKWLATHSFYSEQYGYPILRSDCINISPNVLYVVTINCESENAESAITPTITIPMKKGCIITTNKVYAADNTPVIYPKNIFVLSTCNNKNNPASDLILSSELGCFEVSYHYKTSDYRGVPFWASSKLIQSLGMEKEYISESKVRYKCKVPSCITFNNYVFTIEWYKK